MPILAPILGEEMLLIVGLLGGCTHVITFSETFTQSLMTIFFGFFWLNKKNSNIAGFLVWHCMVILGTFLALDNLFIWTRST